MIVHRPQVLLLVLALVNVRSGQAQALLLPERGAIFPLDSARQLMHPCSRIAAPRPTGAWTPAPQDIAALERALAPVLARKLREEAFPFIGADTTKIPLTPADYYRQYVGVIVHGRRLIYINGFHSMFLGMPARVDSALGSKKYPAEWDWRRHPVYVCDGWLWILRGCLRPSFGPDRGFRFQRRWLALLLAA